MFSLSFVEINWKTIEQVSVSKRFVLFSVVATVINLRIKHNFCSTDPLSFMSSPKAFASKLFIVQQCVWKFRILQNLKI